MFKKFIYRFRWLILLSAIFGTISAYASVGMIAILSELISDYGDSNDNSQFSFLFFMGVVIAVIIFSSISNYISLYIGTKMIFEIRHTLLRRILATPYEQIEKLGRHKINAVMTDDVGSLSDGVNEIARLITNIATILLCFVYLIYMSWQLFMLLVVGLIIAVTVSRLILKLATPYQEKSRELMDGYFSNLDAIGNGGKEINLDLNRRHHFVHHTMAPVFKKIRNADRKVGSVFIVMDGWTGLAIFTMIGVITYGGSVFVSGIETQVIVAFVLVIFYLVDPISDITHSSEIMNAVWVALTKINRMNLAPEIDYIDASPRDKKLQRFKTIELNDIKFSYSSDKEQNRNFVFGPASYTFRAGEITFITGENGAGKSTLLNVLSGLYMMEQGEIRADGRKLGDELALDEYKNSIAASFCDLYIFDHVLNSIGVPANDAVIKNHLDDLKMTGKVSAKNGVLSTTDLSQGQKRRLALLQTFLDESYVCIFDEWSANQDPEFKHYFYHHILIKLKMEGRIVIVVTHDDQYFHLADQLITLRVSDEMAL